MEELQSVVGCVKGGRDLVGEVEGEEEVKLQVDDKAAVPRVIS